MWLVAEAAAKSPIKITTMRLFDNQQDAEAYANNLIDGYSIVCYYFKNPNEKYTKRFEYNPSYGAYAVNTNAWVQVPYNNANFTP